MVLALPRGGVPVGFEVARALQAPLEVFVARKIGAPGQTELGIGAIAEGGGAVLDQRATLVLGISPAQLKTLASDQQVELERRVRLYRGDRALPVITGRDVVLVDDGLATGVTAEAALQSLRQKAPRRLVLAVPVCAPESRERLASVADEVVFVASPPAFRAVGLWYDDFSQTTDDDVRDLLASAAAHNNSG